jgi:hypothetical protein
MRRRNQPRVLPPLLPEKASTYLFEPDEEERQYVRNERHRQNSLAKLRKLDAPFADQQIEYLRSKCAALQSVIDADRAWLAAQAEREAELKRVNDWWASEREKELKAEDEQRRKKLARATEQINRDTVRREREQFSQRGLIRGKKQ